MSTTSSADKTSRLVSVIQEILLAEPAGLTSREIAHQLVIAQAPYSSSSSASFIKRVQRILSTYNSSAKTSKGSYFRYDHDASVWTFSSSESPDLSLLTPDFSTIRKPAKKLPAYHLSRNTSATTNTMTPTPSTSSLSLISSRVGSSLTTGIMEQVKTWRAGGETDDDDEASLELYSNPPRHRASFPSQDSRDESFMSGGSVLNGMDILPTLHQLQFPQHPLEHPDDSDIFSLSQGIGRNSMPPPSSTASAYRRHSISSHQQRPVMARPNRLSQDESVGDQFVPSAARSTFQAMTADILARNIRQPENRFKSPGVSTTNDPGRRSPVNNSGFPSPQMTIPSPRAIPAQGFIRPSHSGSIRGDPNEHHQRHPSLSSQLRLSPNQLENVRSRSQGRRSMDEQDHIESPLDRKAVRRTPPQTLPRGSKEDPRLRDLGATLQKSLSFNGEEEYPESIEDGDVYRNREPSRPTMGSRRHHPYLNQGPSTQQRQRASIVQREKKGKGRAMEADEDSQLMGKTPVLLSAINTSQTNVLSQIQNLQSVNQEDLNLFRRELYSSLQHAFTRLSDQVESVGRAVESAEAAQRDSIRQLGVTIGSAMGEVISKMSEQIQHQIQHQNQQLYHGAYSPSQATFRQPTPFSVAQGIPIAQASGSSPSLFPAGTSPGSLANPNRYSGSWKREQDVPNYDEDEDEEEEDHGRGKRRAVAIERRPRSTSSTRKTVMRPRSEFDDL